MDLLSDDAIDFQSNCPFGLRAEPLSACWHLFRCFECIQLFCRIGKLSISKEKSTILDFSLIILLLQEKVINKNRFTY